MYINLYINIYLYKKIIQNNVQKERVESQSDQWGGGTEQKLHCSSHGLPHLLLCSTLSSELCRISIQLGGRLSGKGYSGVDGCCGCWGCWGCKGCGGCCGGREPASEGGEEELGGEEVRVVVAALEVEGVVEVGEEVTGGVEEVVTAGGAPVAGDEEAGEEEVDEEVDEEEEEEEEDAEDMGDSAISLLAKFVTEHLEDSPTLCFLAGGSSELSHCSRGNAAFTC